MADENQGAVDNTDAAFQDLEAENNMVSDDGLPEKPNDQNIEALSNDHAAADMNAGVNSIREARTEAEIVETSETDIADDLLSDLSATELNPLGGNVMSIKKIQSIKVKVQVMLGSVTLSVSRLASLKKGELLKLDTGIGDPIKILANGQLIAKGEIVVLEETPPKFGVSLVEIVDADATAL